MSNSDFPHHLYIIVVLLDFHQEAGKAQCSTEDLGHKLLVLLLMLATSFMCPILYSTNFPTCVSRGWTRRGRAGGERALRGRSVHPSGLSVSACARALRYRVAKTNFFYHLTASSDLYKSGHNVIKLIFKRNYSMKLKQKLGCEVGKIVNRYQDVVCIIC